MDIKITEDNIDFVEGFINKLGEYEDIDEEPKRLEKIAKALEIIKEKGIVVQFIKEVNSVEQYNAAISGLLLKPLTQDEFDLLKEVLL